jgi:ABC-type dipeptide/oligopeptide/nickel transport system ATPase component
VPSSSAPSVTRPGTERSRGSTSGRRTRSRRTSAARRRARLQLAIEDRDPSLVVGESGVGKSTSLRSVLATLDKRAFQLIELDEPRLNHHPRWRLGPRRAEVERLLQEFFAPRR